jgi:hypothetical protein
VVWGDSGSGVYVTARLKPQMIGSAMASAVTWDLALVQISQVLKSTCQIMYHDIEEYCTWRLPLKKEKEGLTTPRSLDTA